MTTEIVSRNQREPVIIQAGFFYSISREGNVVRFKPGRKKKEAVTEAVVARELPVAEALGENPVTN